MERYRHTQIGWMMVGPWLALLLIMMVPLFAGRPSRVFLPGVCFLSFGILARGALTVIVDDERLLLRFGIGLIRKGIPIDSIRSFSAVRNVRYYGCGTHSRSGGVVYHATGRGAIDLWLTNGTYVRVGTDDQAGLASALRTLTIVESEPMKQQGA